MSNLMIGFGTPNRSFFLSSLISIVTQLLLIGNISQALYRRIWRCVWLTSTLCSSAPKSLFCPTNSSSVPRDCNGLVGSRPLGALLAKLHPSLRMLVRNAAYFERKGPSRKVSMADVEGGPRCGYTGSLAIA